MSNILDEIGLNAYKKPLSAIRDQPTWPSLSNRLHVAILLIDFDTEVAMNGLLGFLQNSTGAYLDQTIEAFRLVGDTGTAATLSQVSETMQKHDVSHQRLREPHRHTREYQITTFAELHGSSMDDFVDEICRLEGFLYTGDPVASPWPLVEKYLEPHAAAIRSEIGRICGPSV